MVNIFKTNELIISQDNRKKSLFEIKHNNNNNNLFQYLLLNSHLISYCSKVYFGMSTL